MKPSSIFCAVLLPLVQVQTLSNSDRSIQRISLVERLQFSQSPTTLQSNSSFEVQFSLDNNQTRIRLDLSPARHVVGRDVVVDHVARDGLMRRATSPTHPLVYKGSASMIGNGSDAWQRAGWARIMVVSRNDTHLIEGVFSVHGNHHHVVLDSHFRKSQLPDESAISGARSPYMMVWKESDTQSQPDDDAVSRCAAETTAPQERALESRHSRSVHTDDLLQQRQLAGFNPVDAIGSTDGCPSERMVATVGIATDCTYTSEFDSLNDARDNIISQINIASQAFEDSFNIALRIGNLTISDASCPSSSNSVPWNTDCSGDVDIGQRLSLFSEWALDRSNNENAAWTLLSACRTGSTIGIAWTGNTCRSTRRRFSQTNNPATNTNVVVRTNSEWQVIAHELAHNFGARHDCTSSDSCNNEGASSSDCCPLSRSVCSADGEYIMNPQSMSNQDRFSPCTVGTVCTAMGREWIDTSCLARDDGSAPDVPEVEDDDDDTGGGGEREADGSSEGGWPRSRVLAVAIPVSVGGFLLIVLIAYCAIRLCIKRRRGTQARRRQTFYDNLGPGSGVGGDLPAPPPMAHRYM